MVRMHGLFVSSCDLVRQQLPGVDLNRSFPRMLSHRTIGLQLCTVLYQVDGATDQGLA
jgi:hypothetical protein